MELLVQLLLVDKRQNCHPPAQERPASLVVDGVGREPAEGGLVLVHRPTDLPQVVDAALAAACRPQTLVAEGIRRGRTILAYRAGFSAALADGQDQGSEQDEDPCH